MRPVERRLLRRVPALRRMLTVATVVALGHGVLVVVQAGLLATALARRDASALIPFAAVVALRAALTCAAGVAARRTAAGVKRRLRAELLARATSIDARALDAGLSTGSRPGPSSGPAAISGSRTGSGAG